jgi:hypothetical protein
LGADPRYWRRRFWHVAIAASAAATVFGLAIAAGSASAKAGFFSDATGRLFGSRSYALDLAPIVGAPPNISQQLVDNLVSAGKDRKLTLTLNGMNAPYTLRGYLVATTEKGGSKISYIWDIGDAKGQRVGRVSGEQLIAGRSGGDPWSAVDSTELRGLADKIASQIYASLSGGGDSDTTTASPTPAPAPSAPAAQPTAPAAATPAPTGPVMALVSPVSGAPGDGQKALTAALKKQLYAGGVKLATAGAGASNVYTVKGTVSMRDTGGGKQSIRIDWLVLNPNGSKRGTVSQQNTVAKGMLDGPWGAIADAAAADAAKGIIKLLPNT